MVASNPEYVYTIGPVGFRVKYLKTDPKYGRVYRTTISDPNNVLTTFDLDVEEEFAPIWWGGSLKSGKTYRQRAAESTRTDREIADHTLNSLLRMIDEKSPTLEEAGINRAYVAHLRGLLAPYQEYDSNGDKEGTWKTSRLNPKRQGNPGNPPPELAQAIDGYEDFHAWEPKEIGEMNLVIPLTVCVVGEMQQTLYRSSKWENKSSDYFHDHDPGVMIGRTDAEAAQENPNCRVERLPHWIRNTQAVYLLGQCLGYSYVQPDGEPIEAQVGRPLPELYAVPNRKALLVVDVAGDTAECLAVIWGGNLIVKNVGIVG